MARSDVLTTVLNAHTSLRILAGIDQSVPCLLRVFAFLPSFFFLSSFCHRNNVDRKETRLYLSTNIPCLYHSFTSLLLVVSLFRLASFTQFLASSSRLRLRHLFDSRHCRDSHHQLDDDSLSFSMDSICPYDSTVNI